MHPTPPPSRYGDWNRKNRELLAETQRLGGNPFYKKILEMNEEERRIDLLFNEICHNASLRTGAPQMCREAVAKQVKVQCECDRLKIG